MSFRLTIGGQLVVAWESCRSGWMVEWVWRLCGVSPDDVSSGAFRIEIQFILTGWPS
jgi:hypothetical protein